MSCKMDVAVRGLPPEGTCMLMTSLVWGQVIAEAR